MFILLLLMAGRHLNLLGEIVNVGDNMNRKEQKEQRLTNIYINNFELKSEKSDEELMTLTKEEIITYKNIQISQLHKEYNVH